MDFCLGRSQGDAMQSDGSYEIFKKAGDNTTVMIEVVKGIEEARKRVDELNGTGAAEYFIVDPDHASAVDPVEPDVRKDPFAL